MMNSLARVLSTIEGRPVDRPAFTLTLSLYGARLTGCPLPRYYTDPGAYVDGQCAVREMFEPDLLLSPFVLTALGEAFGSEAAYLEHQAPNVARPAVSSAREAVRMPLPDIESHPRLLFVRETVRRLSARYQGHVPIVAVVAGPVDLPSLVMGMEPWLDALLFDQKTARQVLDLHSRFFVRWCNALLDDGASLLAFSGLFCNPTVVSQRVMNEVALPALAAVLPEIRGPLVMHHGGGRLSPFLACYTMLPNVAGFVVDSRDSLIEAREKLGATPVLLGNLDGPTLDLQTPEQIRSRCEQILADRAGDAHFIFATSGADVPLTTPPESINVISQTIRCGRKELT